MRDSCSAMKRWLLSADSSAAALSFLAMWMMARKALASPFAGSSASASLMSCKAASPRPRRSSTSARWVRHVWFDGLGRPRHCSARWNFSLRLGVAERRVIQNPLHRISRLDDRTEGGRGGGAGDEHLAAADNPLLAGRQSLGPYRALKNRQLRGVAAQRHLELGALDRSIQVRRTDPELLREAGDEVTRTAGMRIEAGSCDVVLEELDDDLRGGDAQRDGRVPIHPHQGLGLDEQRGPSERAGPQPIPGTYGRIKPLDLQPGVGSSALDFERALNGNDARNGRCARCSFLGESRRGACGCENKEPAAPRGTTIRSDSPAARSLRSPEFSCPHTPRFRGAWLLLRSTAISKLVACDRKCKKTHEKVLPDRTRLGPDWLVDS